MAGGARPDPFRTRKLSRRAPMVLRGQPVGEQGAADRWTALDPFRAGRGGAAGGDPSAAPPSFFSISFSRGPSGALFHAAGVRGRRFGSKGSRLQRRGTGRCLPVAEEPAPCRLFRARRFACPAIWKGPACAPSFSLSRMCVRIRWHSILLSRVTMRRSSY